METIIESLVKLGMSKEQAKEFISSIVSEAYNEGLIAGRAEIESIL